MSETDRWHPGPPDAASMTGEALAQVADGYTEWRSGLIAHEMQQLGLGFFAGDGSIWVSLIDPAVHAHDRWLFRLQADARNGFVAHGRERPGTWDSPRRGEGVDLRSRLAAFRLQAEDVNRQLAAIGKPQRTLPWLMAHHQVFGHLDTTLISLLPEKIAWASLHEVLNHQEAWAKAQAVQDMPRDLLLRMHGLGEVIDHRRRSIFYPEKL